jgi:nicotinamide mononucleotide transporter
LSLSPEASRILEILATLFGVAYVVLAARRRRLCWIPGAIGSALLGLLSYLKGLPMQAGLNAFYVGMAVYGFWNWRRTEVAGELPVGYAPVWWHLAALAVILPLSWFSAGLLARETGAAWPLMDSLTTWASVFATWLAARARIENWVYWIVIDGVLVYLYYMQDAPIIALQMLAFTGMALGGFLVWRRRMHLQVASQ